MSAHPLLIELFTEELPPKALLKLGQAFAQGLQDGLAQHGLVAHGNLTTPFASPRRLAARLTGVLSEAPPRPFSEKLMPVKVGLDGQGNATPALIKKLAAKGLESIEVASLGRESDGKQDYLVASGTAPGASLSQVLEGVIESALQSLPIPKVMRYQLADGQTTVKFVRPAHALVTLHGDEVIPASILGLKADRCTHGHRFLHPGKISISHADAYEHELVKVGHVVASFEARRTLIAEALRKQSAELNATIGQGPEVDALLDEVTALVESPAVYVGYFEERFLDVPQECLILTMRLNQKYFPLFDPASGKLTHRFLIVSNMPCDNPANIIEGNVRVVRPRLADAQFFFETDRKIPLHQRVDQLSSIVYHNKLGTQLQRVGRVRRISTWLAKTLGASEQLADRAALLAKADLTTNMVGEFPELQGVMGCYYARGDGEADEVALALQSQYQNRIDAAVDPTSLIAVILFMAERAETLVGIWGIGLAPTGERDPFGLRRAALGLISAFEQLTAGGMLSIHQPGPLAIQSLLQTAADTFDPGVLAETTVEEACTFVYERYRNQLIQASDRNAVEAVLALTPPLHQVTARVVAAETFAQSPAAASLAAANKRIGNLLKKADALPDQIDPALLSDPAEQSLASTIAQLKPQAAAQMLQGDFVGALSTLALARDQVDQFFNDVMVMADDPALRQNRLALLNQLHSLMNQVADISRLAQ